MFDNKATGTIIDDDPDPNPDARASVNDIQVTEGDSGITKGTFTVSLDRPAERVLQYDVTSTNGETNGERSATPQIDFYANSDLIIFNPGEQSKTFSLDVLGDTVDEGDEYVIVRLTHHGYEPGGIARRRGRPPDPGRRSQAGCRGGCRCERCAHVPEPTQLHDSRPRSAVRQAQSGLVGDRAGRRQTCSLALRPPDHGVRRFPQERQEDGVRGHRTGPGRRHGHQACLASTACATRRTSTTGSRRSSRASSSYRSSARCGRPSGAARSASATPPRDLGRLAPALGAALARASAP